MSLVSLARHGRLVALASCALILVPTFAMAKASRGTSSGSRGERTNQAVPSTNTAPSAAQPMQRSATPGGTAATPAAAARPAAAAPAAAAAAQAARPSFARNMMMGIGAGLLGAGLFGLLSGSGLFSGLGGFASILGLLMQVALIGGLVWLALRFFRRRQEPTMAAAAPGVSLDRLNNISQTPQMARETMAPQNIAPQAMGAAAGVAAGVAATPAGSDTVGLTGEDFGVFERLLSEVNTAYSQEDLAALQRYATPEMVGYFAEDMKENASKGLVDRTSDVKLLQGDLAEAWVEGDTAYATVAMRFEGINTLADRKTGKVIEGNATIPQQSTELWTFACRRGASWQVSAIQQPN